MPWQNYAIPPLHLPVITQLSLQPDGLNTRHVDDVNLAPPQRQALQILRDLQNQLLADAQAFFSAGVNAVEHPPVNVPPQEEPASFRLGALLNRDGGVAMGSQHDKPSELSRLITLLPELKSQGLQTLYVSGLMADLHQGALDQGLAAPQAAWPQELRAYINAYDQSRALPAKSSLLRLLDSARQQGVRVVALDCAASCSLSVLDARQQAEIANYFSQMLIREQHSAGSRWMAWLDHTRLNRFNGVPGLAELTQVAGVRVQQADLRQMDQWKVRVDLGEAVVQADGMRYWIKGDLLLTPNPLISQEALASIVYAKGAFAIVARPENGEFELHHRSNDGTLVFTAIQRDSASPHLFFIERDNASPIWRPVFKRRYHSLGELSDALHTQVGLTNAWPGRIPILDTSALELAAQRPSGPLPMVPHAPIDTVPHTQTYLFPPDIAEQLLDIEQSSPVHGLDTRYGSASTSDLMGLFATKRGKLLTDASLFFRQPLPQRLPLPTLPYDTPLDVALIKFIEHHPGIVIGESHAFAESKQLLIEQFARLRQHGVQTFYLEHLLADRHQPLLDAWNAQPANAPMPDVIRSYLNDQNVGQKVFSEIFNFTTVVQAAHDHGIAIIAIDCISSYHVKGLANNGLMNADPRIGLMNYFAARRIAERQSQMPEAKWMALIGNRHAGRAGLVPGLEELTGAIGVNIGMDKGLRGIQPDVGAWVNAGILSSDPIHIQTDMVTTTTPLRPDEAVMARLRDSGDYAFVSEPQPALYYRQGDRRAVLPLLREGNQWSLPSPPLRELYDRKFSALNDFATFLSSIKNLRNVSSQPPLAQASRSPEDTPASRPLEAFEQRRQAVLFYQVFFADEATRRAFLAGKANWQTELASLALPADSTLDQLKTVFAERAAQLSAKQQGALLAAIGDRQATLAQQLTQDWQSNVTAHGGQVIRTLAHNRYLAAANRAQGLCAGLTAHLAAAWLQDQQSSGGHQAFNGYVAGLTDAMQTPDTPNARLLDLGISAWQFGPPEQAFGSNSPLDGLTLANALEYFRIAQAPAAFELALGSHAMLLAKDSTGFTLIDPNFGRCQLPNHAALSTVLTWHSSLIKPWFDPDAATVSLSLRRYRDDLPTQKLFAQQETGLLSTLRVADLCAPDALRVRLNATTTPLVSDKAFLRLQRQLTIAEYRQSLQSANMTLPPISTLLDDILARHQAPAASLRTQARHIRIAFNDPHASLKLEFDGHEPLTIRINGQRFPQDVALLRQIEALRQNMGGRGPLLRIKSWLQRSPRLEVNRQVLTTALPL